MIQCPTKLEASPEFNVSQSIPYFTEVCAAIESVLSQHGMMSFLCNTNESIERQERFIGTLAEHQADGLILCPSAGTNVKSLQPLIKRSLPTVLLTRDIKGTELDFVGNDDFLALKLVTEHLIGLGHHRIVMIGGGQHTSTSQLRRAGYCAAMEESGLEVDPTLVIDCVTKPKAGEEAVKKVLAHRNPPTAISCFTDLIALGVISGRYRMGATPGRDIAVIGCDDIEEAGRAYIQLTTAKVQKIGYRPDRSRWANATDRRSGFAITADHYTTRPHHSGVLRQ